MEAGAEQEQERKREKARHRSAVSAKEGATTSPNKTCQAVSQQLRSALFIPTRPRGLASWKVLVHAPRLIFPPSTTETDPPTLSRQAKDPMRFVARFCLPTVLALAPRALPPARMSLPGGEAPASAVGTASACRRVARSGRSGPSMAGGMWTRTEARAARGRMCHG